MKKIGVLNSEISEVIASLGHKDMLVVSDAGLPIPRSVKRIDLAVCPGIPGLIDTIKTIAEELQVEKIVIARETKQISPHIYESIKNIFNEAEFEEISHEEFKELTEKSVAIIRTGEFTSYANVILVSGVVF